MTKQMKATRQPKKIKKDGHEIIAISVKVHIGQSLTTFVHCFCILMKALRNDDWIAVNYSLCDFVEHSIVSLRQVPCLSHEFIFHNADFIPYVYSSISESRNLTQFEN